MSRFGRLEFLKATTQHEAEVRPQHALETNVELANDDRDWIKTALQERRNGLFETALRHYSRALELDRSLVAGWVGQVQMLIALEEYPEAEVWARKALELFRNNADLLAGRAQALCRTGDLKSAQASCDAAIGQQGMFAYPWIARGELMLARREPLDDFCFDKAVQLNPNWLVPLELGAIYLHYNRPTKALSRVRAAVEQAPDHAYCWYRQGVCELKLGFNKAAQQSFEHCLELVPNHADASRELHKLINEPALMRGFLRRLFRRR